MIDRNLRTLAGVLLIGVDLEGMEAYETEYGTIMDSIDRYMEAPRVELLDAMREAFEAIAPLAPYVHRAREALDALGRDCPVTNSSC